MKLLRIRSNKLTLAVSLLYAAFLGFFTSRVTDASHSLRSRTFSSSPEFHMKDDKKLNTEKYLNADDDYFRSKMADINPDDNFEPLIGILSQPLYHSLPNVSFIAASYVQFVEAAGARAVPIIYSDPKEEIIKRFYEVSGIIFPGGTVGLDASSAAEYDDIARMLFNMVIDEGNKGNVVALHGFCMGFQMLLRFSADAGNEILHKGFDSSEHPNELMWTLEADKSRLVGNDFPHDLSTSATSQYLRLRMSQIPPVVIENHHEGIDVDEFNNDAGISKMWKLLSISRDRTGKNYVSTIESVEPHFISGTQWHPEKNAFEWKSKNIPHQIDAVAVTQFIGNRFVNQAKLSKHSPKNLRRLNDLVIWNDPPVYHSPLVRDFELIFVYGPQDVPKETLRHLTKNPTPKVLNFVDQLYAKVEERNMEQQKFFIVPEGPTKTQRTGFADASQFELFDA